MTTALLSPSLVNIFKCIPFINCYIYISNVDGGIVICDLRIVSVGMLMSMDIGGSEGNEKFYDDDGRLRRTGTLWTASAHIITAVVGSGVLSLAWCIAQLGWVGGLITMVVFSFITYYTSILLSYCYRSGDPDSGHRNYTYMDAVRSHLGTPVQLFWFDTFTLIDSLKCMAGEGQVKMCGYLQYVNIFGTAIGYTIAAAISMIAVVRSDCFHRNGHGAVCNVPSNPFIIIFGAIEVVFSQIPDFDQIWWLSILAAVMSFSYSFICLYLGIAQVVANGVLKGNMTGIVVGTEVTKMGKLWRVFQALGNIAFAYTYSVIIIEIQDTIRSPPSERKTMKKATFLSVSATSVFYIACGSMGYLAFGNSSPGNLLTGFGFFDPFWLINFANVALVVHLIGAYQVFSQPLFAFIEKWAVKKYPNSTFFSKEITVAPGVKLNLFRLVWRTAYVVITTLISMMLPFFNDIVGFLGAIGFWPLTIYYPVEMYIAARKIPKWTTQWILLEIVSLICLVVSVIAAVGSIVGIVLDLKVYRPFSF